MSILCIFWAFLTLYTLSTDLLNILASNMLSLGIFTKNLPTNSGLFSSTSSFKTSNDKPLVLFVPVPTKLISSPKASAMLNVQVSPASTLSLSVLPSVTFILVN